MVSPGVPNMAMVNVNNFLNVKDSRWLQLEVCREFQRNKCTRPDTECKFAHPPPNVEVQNGRVTACYDSIKGRCNREKPPCKYFHPPQHLKDQLLINGRNHLALKNAIMTQIQGLSPGTPVVPGTIPVVRFLRSRVALRVSDWQGWGGVAGSGLSIRMSPPHAATPPFTPPSPTSMSAIFLTDLKTRSGAGPECSVAAAGGRRLAQCGRRWRGERHCNLPGTFSTSLDLDPKMPPP
ncbi:putative protein suppressor 2 of zeste-like isoform X7 [Penaeus vannamei]|uniref:C3H1-type domain-containing protein n=1 Tax=Penaeus vannamei TaxID=6689 RepID=A0A423TDV7_PENVA|nr:putative protein suppressor 2 of zeste-like isoform X7 [Penaeus vannamei]